MRRRRSGALQTLNPQPSSPHHLIITIDRGKEAAFLADLTLDRLPNLDRALLRRLERLGIRTLVVTNAASSEAVVRDHSSRLGQHRIDSIDEIVGDVTPEDFPAA